jgi:hypothetical protein
MIVIRLIAPAFGREFVTRHSRHRIEHTSIGNAARPQLGIDHAQPETREYGGFARIIHAQLEGCPARPILFLAPPNADIEADHAVLIAGTDNGDIAIDVVFALNDLL